MSAPDRTHMWDAWDDDVDLGTFSQRLHSRFDRCDGCYRTEHDATILECVTRRPSDPTSLCCVMTTCSICTPDHTQPSEPLPADVVPSIGTSGQISEWVEEHGHKHGIAFHE